MESQVKSAAAKQVGGDHYKEWLIQPYILMQGMSGPAAHVAGYLLRTKGDDDLDKAAHWCDLQIEAGFRPQVIQLAKEPTLYMNAVSWLTFNKVDSNSFLYKAIVSLWMNDFKSARASILHMKQEKADE